MDEPRVRMVGDEESGAILLSPEAVKEIIASFSDGPLVGYVYVTPDAPSKEKTDG